MYRLLLLAFPPAFRREFGDEMAATFDDMRAAARRNGRLAAARFYWAAAVGALRHGLAERRAHRARRGDSFLRGLAQDMRFAARLFVRRPGFVMSTVLTLSLGIGLTVAAFSAVNGVLVQWLQIPDPAQVVRVAEIQDGHPQPMGAPSFAAYRDGTRPLFSAMAGYRTIQTTLSGLGDAARLPVASVTPEFFAVVGVPPVFGRALDASDAPDDAVMISGRFWRARFGEDPHVLDRALDLDGFPVRIAGVLPDTATFPANVDIWRPIRFSPEEASNRNNKTLTVIGRLRDGVTTEAASQALAGLAARLNQGDATYKNYTAAAVNLREDTIGGIRRDLLFVQAVAAIVLLIGCANVANLMLVAASARRYELGIRAALGAGRGRLLRQLLAESALLSIMGAIGGVLVAAWLVPVALNLYPGELPGMERIGISAGELLLACVVSLGTTMVFGLAPAAVVSHAGVSTSLREGPRTGATRTSRGLRWVLVAAEIVLTLTLLSGASLLARNYAGLTLQETGFDAAGVETAMIALPPADYPTANARGAMFGTLLDRIKRQPGVLSAAAAFPLPFDGVDIGVGLKRLDAAAGSQLITGSMQVVSPEYFDTLGVPLRRGRLFTAADTAASAPVLIVNEQFARRYGLSGDVLNMPVDVDGRTGRIVGVVADTRFNFYQAPKPIVFFPLAQRSLASMKLLVKTAGRPDQAAPMLRDLVRSADARLPVLVPSPLEAVIARSVATRRFNMTLLGLLAVCAVALAAIGLYGVMAYVIGQREREMGIRLALGSTRAGLQALLVRQGLAVVAVGIAGGLAGSWYITGLLKRELFHVMPHDPRPMAGAALALAVVALVACWLPSRRVGRIDPISVLRADQS